MSRPFFCARLFKDRILRATDEAGVITLGSGYHVFDPGRISQFIVIDDDDIFEVRKVGHRRQPARIICVAVAAMGFDNQHAGIFSGLELRRRNLGAFLVLRLVLDHHDREAAARDLSIQRIQRPDDMLRTAERRQRYHHLDFIETKPRSFSNYLYMTR